jgi:hypothetical protein
VYIPEDNNKARWQWLIRMENDEEAAKMLKKLSANH